MGGQGASLPLMAMVLLAGTAPGAVRIRPGPRRSPAAGCGRSPRAFRQPRRAPSPLLQQHGRSRLGCCGGPARGCGPGRALGGGGMRGIGVCPALIKLSELHSSLLPALPWAPLPLGELGHHVPSALLGPPAPPCSSVPWCDLVLPYPLISLRDRCFLVPRHGALHSSRGTQCPLVPAASPCALLLPAPCCLVSPGANPAALVPHVFSGALVLLWREVQVPEF